MKTKITHQKPAPRGLVCLLAFCILHSAFFISACVSTRAQVPPANSVEIKQRNAAGDAWEFVSLTPQPNSALTFGSDRKPATALLSTFASAGDLSLLNSNVSTMQIQIATHTGKIADAESSITALTTAIDAKQPASSALSKITESGGLPLWNGSTWPGGSGGTSYTLPLATATTLGGIKVGANLSVTADGTLSATGGGGGESLWTANGGNIYRASGNVGIGKSNPTALLDFPASAGNKIQLYGGSSSDRWGFGVQSWRFVMYLDGSGSGSDAFTGAFSWRKSAPTGDPSTGAEVARLFTTGRFDLLDPINGVIRASGNSVNYFLGPVGIKKNNPAYPLDVNGDINFTGVLRKNGQEVQLGGGGSYTLPPATGTTLGGIKVGANLSVTADGTLSATGGGGGGSGQNRLVFDGEDVQSGSLVPEGVTYVLAGNSCVVRLFDTSAKPTDWCVILTISAEWNDTASIHAGSQRIRGFRPKFINMSIGDNEISVVAMERFDGSVLYLNEGETIQLIGDKTGWRIVSFTPTDSI